RSRCSGLEGFRDVGCSILTSGALFFFFFDDCPCAAREQARKIAVMATRKSMSLKPSDMAKIVWRLGFLRLMAKEADERAYFRAMRKRSKASVALSVSR